jgi:hypothetical protein
MIAFDDVLVHVGEESAVTARLALRLTIRPRLKLSGVPIHFSVEGEEIGEVNTGPDGFATMTYTPRQERNYRVCASYRPPGIPRPVAAVATIFSRGTRRDAIILDVDRTLFASSTFGALFRRSRNIPPLHGAVEVTTALSQKYDLIIITGRKSYLRGKTRRWLREKGFPPAPMFFAPPFRPFLSHERFKFELIKKLRGAWKNITVGIGDRDSDARAYLANGLKAIILREGCACPRGAISVPDWQTIRKVLLL